MGKQGDQADDLSELRRRLEAVEAAVVAVQGRGTVKATASPVVQGAAGPGWRAEARPAPAFELAAAQALLRDVLPALQAVARHREDRLLLVAVADAQTGGSGSPQSVRALLAAELVEPLARLAAAAGSGPRARLLQALALGEARTTAELAEASGAAGGNLYQHLHALHGANLLSQPARGRYQLTANGRHAVELLLCAALQVRMSLPPEVDRR